MKISIANSESQDLKRINIEQYNHEIETALEQALAGNYITLEELEIEMDNW